MQHQAAVPQAIFWALNIAKIEDLNWALHMTNWKKSISFAFLQK
jgi:hypothetical protein